MSKKKKLASVDKNAPIETPPILLKTESTTTPINEETQRPVHELQVHQIELEMQTEELRQTQIQLAKSRDRYINLYDFAPVGYLTIMSEGLIGQANLICANLLGVNRENLLKTPFPSFVSRDHQDVYYQHRRQTLGSETVQTCELELVTKEGKQFHAELKSIAVAEGHMRMTISDITDRKRSLERLARLNACFLGFGPDPLANINQLTALCGELLGADCALYNRLNQGMLCSWGQWQTPPGYNPEDNPEGHICYDVIQQAQDDVIIIRNLPDTIYAATDPTVIPFNLQTYIGKAIQLEGDAVASLCVVFMQDFEPTAEDLQIMTFIGAAIAIEERRRGAEVSLKETHEHLRATMDALPDLMFELDHDGRYYDYHIPHYKSPFVPPDEFLGKTVPEVLPPEAADVIMAAIEQAGAAGQSTGTVYALDTQDGRRWYEASIARKGESESRDGRFIALCRDITEEVQAEVALRESNEQLSKSIAELKETQAQMMQQERQAAVGQLAAGIAHDFNNLMAAILLHAELMLKTSDLSLRDRRKIELIHQQGRRAADLTQQILDFSRKSVMHREILDLHLFLQELARLFKRTVPENIQLSLSVQLDTCLVNADPTRLQQAILNLVNNARDAMPEGGRLDIGLEQVMVREGQARPYPHLTPGFWARLSVTDSGAGIADTDLNRIFEPFYTTKAPLGSGLGLSQVYGIVTQHGGFVDVATTVGEGSAFFLYLPMLVLTETAAPPQNPNLLLMGQGETILIVEDDELVRQSLVEAIEMLNYRPLSAADGRQALSFCQSPENDISLVITDLIMPTMGGEELLNLLRQVIPNVKVIIMTGYPLADKGVEMLSAGAVGWLQKPISLLDLSQELMQALVG